MKPEPYLSLFLVFRLLGLCNIQLRLNMGRFITDLALPGYFAKCRGSSLAGRNAKSPPASLLRIALANFCNT